MYIFRRSSRCSFKSCIVIPRNNVKSLNSTNLDNTISIVPSANGSNFLLITRCVMISRNILDFSSVHENPTELEAAIALCCNNSKVLSFYVYYSIFHYPKTKSILIHNYFRNKSIIVEKYWLPAVRIQNPAGLRRWNYLTLPLLSPSPLSGSRGQEMRVRGKRPSFYTGRCLPPLHRA